jgi:Tetratricopeptide repeat
VVEARQRILGDKHPDTLKSITNLAGTYRALSRMKDAKSLGENVLVAHLRILGRNIWIH